MMNSNEFFSGRKNNDIHKKFIRKNNPDSKSRHKHHDSGLTHPEEFSFRSHKERESEQRGRSKRRKKNKQSRNNSGHRLINKNGTKLNFCGYCNGKLANRIHNKYAAHDEADYYQKMVTF